MSLRENHLGMSDLLAEDEMGEERPTRRSLSRRGTVADGPSAFETESVARYVDRRAWSRPRTEHETEMRKLLERLNP